MKYQFVIIAFVSLVLTAYGELKPGQYSPSAYRDREPLPEETRPAETTAAAHAKIETEEQKELAEEAYPAGTNDPEVLHALVHSTCIDKIDSQKKTANALLQS